MDLHASIGMHLYTVVCITRAHTYSDRIETQNGKIKLVKSKVIQMREVGFCSKSVYILYLFFSYNRDSPLCYMSLEHLNMYTSLK